MNSFSTNNNDDNGDDHDYYDSNYKHLLSAYFGQILLYTLYNVLSSLLHARP